MTVLLELLSVLSDKSCSDQPVILTQVQIKIVTVIPIEKHQNPLSYYARMLEVVPAQSVVGFSLLIFYLLRLYSTSAEDQILQPTKDVKLAQYV